MQEMTKVLVLRHVEGRESSHEICAMLPTEKSVCPDDKLGNKRAKTKLPMGERFV